MQVTLSIICALVARSYSAPDKWGAAFEVGGAGSTDMSVGARILADSKGIGGGLTSAAAGDLDTHVDGGLYRVAGDRAIGVNGGLHKKIGGSINANAIGNLGLDSDLNAGVDGSLATDSYAKVGGHANIASGVDELRQIAAYEGKISGRNSDAHSMGSESLLSLILPETFWMYIGLFIAGVVLVTICCVCTLCGSYIILLRELKSIKTTTLDFQRQFCKTMDASNFSAKKSDDNMKDWDTNC